MQPLKIILQCDIVNYNKKYIYLDLGPVPGTEHLKLLEFPVRRVLKVPFVLC